MRLKKIVSTPIRITLLTGIINSGINAIVFFFIARLIISKLGTEQYSIIALIRSLLPWVMLTDIGLSASVQNYISEQRASLKPYGCYIKTAIFIAFILMFILVPFLYLLSNWFGPFYLSKYDFLSYELKIKIFFIGVLFLALSNLGNIVFKIWFAEKKGYISNLLTILCSLISLLFCVLVLTKVPSIIITLIAILSPLSMIALFALGYFLFKVWHEQITVTALKLLLKRGLAFFLFGVLACITLRLDYPLLSQFATPQEIILYNVNEKIFGLLLTGHGILMTTIWPSFSEYIAMKKWNLVRDLMIKIIKNFLFCVIPLTIIIIACIPIIINFLDINHKLSTNHYLTILYAIYTMLRIIGTTFATILQSMSDIKPFYILGPIHAAVNAILMNELGKLLGIIGIISALIIGECLGIWYLPLRIIKHAKTH